MRAHLRALALAAAFVLVLTLHGCVRQSSGPETVRSDVVLLTTTSFQDTGIAEVLLPAFKKQSGHDVKMIAVGTGAALKQGAQGEGDVLLAHAPEEEKRWMAEGNGTSRRLVMYNDFVLVGPPEDPAKIKGLLAVEAFKRLAERQAPFVSRGDKSGTHTRERSLWKKAAVDPSGKPWYAESGQGMGLTLDIAAQQQRYTLTDRSTFLALQKRLGLAVLAENDPAFLNLYHVMTVSPEKFPKVNAEGGRAFADFLVSDEGQKLIGDFGKEKFGRALFVPAAGMAEEQLLQLSESSHERR